MTLTYIRHPNYHLYWALHWKRPWTFSMARRLGERLPHHIEIGPFFFCYSKMWFSGPFFDMPNHGITPWHRCLRFRF